jgi:hypothetical protein
MYKPSAPRGDRQEAILRYQADTPTWAHFVTMEHSVLEQWLPAIDEMPIPNLINFLHFGHSEPGRKMTGPSEPTMLGAAMRVFPINQVPYELISVATIRLNATSFGSLLSAADAAGSTPLMDAGRAAASPEQGQPVIKRLLAAGAGVTVNMTDSLGRTALMIACQHGFTTGARLLLAHHADAERHDLAGRTALRHACDAGEPGPAMLLLGANVPVDAAALPSCLLMSVRVGLSWTLPAALVLCVLYLALRSPRSGKRNPRAWVSACMPGWMTASGADFARRGKNGRRGSHYRGSRCQRQQPVQSFWLQLLACTLSTHTQAVMAAACAFLAFLTTAVCVADAQFMSIAYYSVQSLAYVGVFGLLAALLPDPNLTLRNISRLLRVLGLIFPFWSIVFGPRYQLIDPLQHPSNVALLVGVMAGKMPLSLAVWTRACCAAHLGLYSAIVMVHSIVFFMHPSEAVRTRLPTWTVIRVGEGAIGLNDLWLAATCCAHQRPLPAEAPHERLHALLRPVMTRRLHRLYRPTSVATPRGASRPL